MLVTKGVPQARKGRGGNKILPRQALYSKIASRYQEVLDELFKLLHSRNESIRLGVAKLLLNKILPDLRSLDWEPGGV